MTDIKKLVGELVEKLQKDPALLKKFQDDPTKALKELTGLEIPKEQLDTLISGVKAKLGSEDLAKTLGAIKKLF